MASVWMIMAVVTTVCVFASGVCLILLRFGVFQDQTSRTASPPADLKGFVAHESSISISTLQASNCGRVASSVSGWKQKRPVSRSKRVVNGRDSLPGQYPWMVMVVVGGQFRCGGSIIGPEHVLTAAHCLRWRNSQPFDEERFYRATDVDVIAGKHAYVIDSRRAVSQSKGEQRLSVKEIIIHPRYDDTTTAKKHDLAVLVINKGFQWTQWVRPICLPECGRHVLSNNTIATITGWGATNPRRRVRWTPRPPAVLQQLTVVVRLRRDCLRKIPAHFHYTRHMTRHQFCAVSLRSVQPSSACNGDSGGPLFLPTGTDRRYVQIGVLSWGFCDSRPGVPSFFTALLPHMQWIKRVVQG